MAETDGSDKKAVRTNEWTSKKCATWSWLWLWHGNEVFCTLKASVHSIFSAFVYTCVRACLAHTPNEFQYNQNVLKFHIVADNWPQFSNEVWRNWFKNCWRLTQFEWHSAFLHMAVGREWKLRLYAFIFGLKFKRENEEKIGLYWTHY